MLIIKSSVATLVLFALSSILPVTVSAQVVINEFAPNASEEWVEFYNASDSAEYLKEYWIDDKPDGGQAKKQLSTLNTDDPKYPYFILGSNYLNNNGDKIILYDKDNQIVDQYDFSSVPGDGLTIGRHPDQSGSFGFLESATRGSANAAKKTDPTPTPTITPTPTPSATPSLTPSPTAKPSPTPKKSPSTTPTPDSTDEPQVLGNTIESLLTASPTGEPLVAGEKHSQVPILAFVFIIPGVVLCIFGALKFFKMRRGEYNDMSESSSFRPQN